MADKQNNSEKRFSATLDTLVENLATTRRSQKQAVSILIDFLLSALSLWGAFSLRYGEPFTDFTSAWQLFILLPIITVFVYAGMGIYRWVIRSSNGTLFKQIIKSTIFAALSLVLVVYILPQDREVPRSTFLIFGMLMVFGACGVRVLWQGLFDTGRSGEPVAIYGTGTEAQLLLSSLRQSKDYRPVLFLDENPKLADSMIGGVPVAVPTDYQLADLLASHEITRVILAFSAASSIEYRDKINRFKSCRVAVQTIPTRSELISGSAQLDHVRDVSIGDILGRSEVAPDTSLLGHCVKDRVVLVTGGGGSIGSELCRQIINLAPEKLLVLDNSESNLYEITEELTARCKSMEGRVPVFQAVLCSVTDKRQVERVVRKHNVVTIYHAAAYKHVPIIEDQPEQGVSVNVFGTLNVLEIAIATGVRDFVLISSDKAVRPTNAMGATKRVAELILQAKAQGQSTTCISMVRFGNVLGSSGSVVPKFKKQIESGGPITLTDPNITRYFMTIPESAQLVLQASAIAKGGDVFVLDMGEPMRIEDLAIAMVRMSGKRLKRETGLDGDIEIVVEGLRPGEKMYEELFIGSEGNSTIVPKVQTAEEVWVEWVELAGYLQELENLSAEYDQPALRKMLLNLAFYGQQATENISNVANSSAKNTGVVRSSSDGVKAGAAAALPQAEVT